MIRLGPGRLLAWLVGSVLRVRRRHVEAAMLRAGVPDAGATASAMYRSLGRGLEELCLMATGRGVPMPCRVEIAPELLERFQSGAIVATAHTGNWDLVACAIASRARLAVVTKRLSIRWLDRLWQGARAARGVRLVHVEGAAREVLRAARNGEIVAMLVDQAPERSRGVVQTSFLGAPAWVNLAPAILARRARVPLVAAFPVRNPDGSHAVRVAGVLDVSALAGARAATDAMLQITAWLDAFVRAHPEQWLWMHRRWKPLPQSPWVPPSPRGSLDRHGGRPAPHR